MSVYDVSGNALRTAYNNAGSYIDNAYDKNGNLVFSGQRNLKVMSYNVGQWYTGTAVRVPVEKKSEYYGLQYGTFDDNSVDILFIQEYLDSWCEDDSSAVTQFIQPFFDHQETTNPRDYIGHSICTNGFAMSNYQSHRFTVNSGAYPTFETAQINVGGVDITLINTHNDYSIANQTQDITDLLSAIAPMEYFILCGDFNIDLSTEDTTSEQYTNSVKRFLDAGYHVGNCVIDWVPTYFSTSAPTGGKFTDQIVTSGNITIKSLYAYTEKLTDGIDDKIDHLPLIAELEIN